MVCNIRQFAVGKFIIILHLHEIREFFEIFDEKLVWHPKIEFANLLKYEKKEIYGGTSPFTFWFVGHIIPNITLIYGEGLQLTFSCKFDFSEFPFDSHECEVTYGDVTYGSTKVQLNSPQAIFGNLSNRIGEEPIILKDLPFPFLFELKPLPVHEKTNSYGWNFSFTGISLKIKRKSLGQLQSSYYYPTASFAFVSMFSFLIKAEKVS